MQLCEIIQTKHTPALIIEAATSFVKKQGRTPVLAMDTPGFVVNRLLVWVHHLYLLRPLLPHATYLSYHH